MNEIHPVKTPEDVEFLQREYNNLHDGYIIALDYKNDIRVDGNRIYQDSNMTLSMKVLVTSMTNAPIVELIFSDVQDFRLPAGGYYIFEFKIDFNTEEKYGVTNKYVLWSDSYYFNLNEPINLNNNRIAYVKARYISWRLL